MQNEKHSAVAETTLPRHTKTQMPDLTRTSRFWRRLPTIVKIIVTVPLVMALLGAEIELRLAPQLDIILTAAGVWSIWAWLARGPSAST